MRRGLLEQKGRNSADVLVGDDLPPRRPRPSAATRTRQELICRHLSCFTTTSAYRPPRRPASSSARSATTARDTPVLSPPTSHVGVCCASRLAGLASADASPAPIVAPSPLKRALPPTRAGRWARSAGLARSSRSASCASSAIRASSRRRQQQQKKER